MIFLKNSENPLKYNMESYKKLIILGAVFILCCRGNPSGNYAMFPEKAEFGEPEQINIKEPETFTVRTKNGLFTVTPKAEYYIHARVASKKSYWLEDDAALAPVDLALAWGKISKPEHLKRLGIRQSGRWYEYRYDENFLVTREYVRSHSCNNHAVPRNENIKQALKKIKKYDLVYIEGFLIDIDGVMKGNRFFWRTSMTRDDEAGGACEIIYVTRLQVNDRVYE